MQQQYLIVCWNSRSTREATVVTEVTAVCDNVWQQGSQEKQEPTTHDNCSNAMNNKRSNNCVGDSETRGNQKGNRCKLRRVATRWATTEATRWAMCANMISNNRGNNCAWQSSATGGATRCATFALATVVRDSTATETLWWVHNNRDKPTRRYDGRWYDNKAEAAYRWIVWRGM